MNWMMIKRLAFKDWEFNRLYLSLYTIVGVLALALLAIENKAAFYVGNVLIISAVIVVGAHLIFATIIMERKEQTQPFVMSLPVSYMEYTMAKILVNLGAFLFIWCILALGVIGMMFTIDSIPSGLIPYTLIALLELVVAYILVLAIAITTESEAWTIVILTMTNICVSLFWFLLGSIESISSHMTGDSPVWNGTAISFLVGELLIAVILIGITFYFQSKKQDFL